MTTEPRLLLVPVSGPRGMGEYARCLAIAEAVRARWPQVQMRFLVSREAPYAASCPFPVEALPSSPTRCTPQVLAAIEGFRPGVVYFDNSGRTRQMAAARAAGAHVVFISSRSRQRRKAFRLRWMRMLAEHWISYPAALTGELTTLERWKLRWLGRPAVRFLDAVVTRPDAAAADALLGERAAAALDVVVVPGGGSSYPDARISPRHFVEWAAALAAQGRSVVVVGGPAFDVPIEAAARLTLLRGVSGGALMALLARAQLVLVNGGDTLAQALALGRACVAVPIAGDQAARIGRAAALGVIAAPASGEVVATCNQLLDDTAARQALQARLAALGWRDATPLILERLGAMLGLA
jgi:putative intracellular protease/amidase